MAVQPVSNVQHKSPIKKFVKTVFIAGAITAGLAIGSKKDVFNKASEVISKNLSEGKGQEITKAVAEKLTNAGKSIDKKATAVMNGIKAKLSTVKVKELTVYKEANRLAQDARKAAQTFIQTI